MTNGDDDLEQDLRDLAGHVPPATPQEKLRARGALLQEITRESKGRSAAQRFRLRSGRGLLVVLVALVTGSGAVAVATQLTSPSSEVQSSGTEPPVYGFEPIPDAAARRLARRVGGDGRVPAQDLRRCRRQEQSAGGVDEACALLLAAYRNGDLRRDRGKPIREGRPGG